MENYVFLSLSYALWYKICGLCIAMNEHQWPEVISRLTQFSLSPSSSCRWVYESVCVCLCARDSGIPQRGEMKQCLRRCIDLKDYCHTDDKTQGWAAVALLTALCNLRDSRLWFWFFDSSFEYITVCENVDKLSQQRWAVLFALQICCVFLRINVPVTCRINKFPVP